MVVAFAVNLILGQFKPGFANQPIAHDNHLWNFLGMALSGLAFALAGGCPGRQLILSGEGDGDAAVFVVGMIVGAGIAHNFALASSARTGRLRAGRGHRPGFLPGRGIHDAGEGLIRGSNAKNRHVFERRTS